MEPIRIVALHGFLGVPDDWQKVSASVRKQKPNIQWKSIDLNKLFSETRPTDFAVATEALHKAIAKEFTCVDLLCGYSLGGRLALHLFKKHLQFISRALIISSQVGLSDFDIEARKTRVANDKKWAERFANGDFEAVVRDWNAQPIFNGSTEPKRNPVTYQRDILSSMLSNLSLGSQDDFRPWITQHLEQITWVCGERDSKYRELETELSSKGIRTKIIPESGHRVIFDNPEAIADLICESI